MIRPAVLMLMLFPAPAVASQYYRAEPVSPPARGHVVARENVWRCGEEACVSNRSGSRPAIVCAGLVRQVGAVRRFVADGTAFTADQLESCNRRAR